MIKSAQQLDEAKGRRQSMGNEVSVLLKPLYAFGKQYCPSPTLSVSQLIYKLTNL